MFAFNYTSDITFNNIKGNSFEYMTQVSFMIPSLSFLNILVKCMDVRIKWPSLKCQLYDCQADNGKLLNSTEPQFHDM